MLSRANNHALAALRATSLRNCGFTRSKLVLCNRSGPRLAQAQQAKAILEPLQKLPEPFRTHTEIETGVRFVRLQQSGPTAHVKNAPCGLVVSSRNSAPDGTIQALWPRDLGFSHQRQITQLCTA